MVDPDADAEQRPHPQQIGLPKRTPSTAGFCAKQLATGRPALKEPAEKNRENPNATKRNAKTPSMDTAYSGVDVAVKATRYKNCTQ